MESRRMPGMMGESSIVQWLWIRAFAGMTQLKNKKFYRLLQDVLKYFN
jgi:hypothetical protein